jgi:nitrate reductase (cytochrome), electron transfer subunit
MPEPNKNYDPHRKAARVMLAVVLVCSVSGFFMGLRQTANTANSRDLAQIAAHPREENPPASEARDYARMRELPKPNHAWSNALESLASPVYDLFASNAPATDADRAQVIAARVGRRAYDSAPPTVPHPIDQTSALSCLACHGEGKVVKGKVAAKISHEPYSNCTQCHVPANGLIAGGQAREEFPLPVSNDFQGLRSFGLGERAYPGAPPTIPHPTSMRLDCTSCHGPGGAVGLKTSHPWRQSCTQCHAPSAELDQRALPFTTQLEVGARELQALLDHTH